MLPVDGCQLVTGRVIVAGHADDDSFTLDIDGETVTTVHRTTASQVHRYKAYATRRAAEASLGDA